MKYLTHRRKALLEAWATYIERGTDILLCGYDRSSDPTDDGIMRTGINMIYSEHLKVVDIYGQVDIPLSITARDISPNLNVHIFANTTVDISVLCKTSISEKQTDVSGKLIQAPILAALIPPEIAENVMEASAHAALDDISMDGDCYTLDYQKIDNEAGGETYEIVTDDYVVEDSTIIITMGGSNGS